MLLILLSLVAGVFRHYASVDRATEFGEKGRVYLTNLVDDILSESKDAYQMVTPTSAALVTELEFLRIDSRQEPTRLPPLPVPPVPLPLTWDSFPAGSRMTVKYHKVGAELVREVTYGDGSKERNSLFQEISGFSSSLSPGNLLQVTVSMQLDGRVESRVGKVYCPCL